MRLGKRRRAGNQVCHLLGAVGRSHELVCRSSFGSELLAARGAADGLQAHLLALRETVRGPASAEKIRRQKGGDALSLQTSPSTVCPSSAPCSWTLFGRPPRTARRAAYGG